MKKSTKMFLRIMPVIFISFMIVGSVFGISATKPAGGNEISGVTGLANDIWSTVAVIVQILAIAAIVIAGVRYMFASANDKADIKKQTLILVAGAILVFAAVPIAQFIQGIGTSAFK